MIRADKDLAFMLQYENVAWYENGKVRILDRRIYPETIKFVECTSHTQVAQAIADMVTQSAGPYTAAGMGMALAAYEAKNQSSKDFMEYMRDAAYTLSHARPTTVEKMVKIVDSALVIAEDALAQGKNVEQQVFESMLKSVNDRYLGIDKIAKHLVRKFPDGGTVMTQCFAETIIGLMLKECRAQNKVIKLICPETRPYFQGSRLTASVIYDMGFDVTVITDNMPAYTIKEKKVDVFTSAADVISCDGHVVNKVGTFQIALAAHHWGIPYFATGMPNPSHQKISSVKIEERDSDFVVQAMGKSTVMKGVKGYYPAFDITPPNLVSGIVTDKGIFPAYDLESYFND